MTETRAQRVALANEILLLFVPHVRLELRGNRIWVAATNREITTRRAAVLNSSGCSLACHHHALILGGTYAGAIAQLVRWVRNDYRYPLETWRYWCGETCKLGRDNGPEILRLLEASSYGDPSRTGCTQCGRPMEKDDGLHWDWFSRKGETIGMQCDWGGCLEKQTCAR